MTKTMAQDFVFQETDGKENKGILQATADTLKAAMAQPPQTPKEPETLAEALDAAKTKASQQIAKDIREMAKSLLEQADQMSPPPQEKDPFAQVVDAVNDAASAAVETVKTVLPPQGDVEKEAKETDSKSLVEKAQESVAEYRAEAAAAVTAATSKTADKVASEMRSVAKAMLEQADQMSPPPQEKNPFTNVVDAVNDAASAAVESVKSVLPPEEIDAEKSKETHEMQKPQEDSTKAATTLADAKAAAASQVAQQMRSVADAMQEQADTMSPPPADKGAVGKAMDAVSSSVASVFKASAPVESEEAAADKPLLSQAGEALEDTKEQAAGKIARDMRAAAEAMRAQADTLSPPPQHCDRGALGRVVEGVKAVFATTPSAEEAESCVN